MVVFRFSYARAVLIATASLVAVSFASAASTKKGPPPLADYLAAGGPPTNAVWSADDYTALKGLIDVRVIPLPRIKPHFTGPLFERMTNPENFVELISGNAPLPDRLRNAGALTTAAAELLKLYAQQHGARVNVEDELTFLYTYLLQMVARTAELQRELERSAGDASSQQAVQNILNQATVNAGNILSGAVTVLVRGSLAPRNQIRIVRGFCELFTTRAALLPLPVIDDLRDRLQPLVQYEENGEAKAELAKAHDLCVAALEVRKGN